MKKLIYLGVLAAALVALAAPVAQAADDDKMFNFHGEIRLRGDYTDSFRDFDNDDRCAGGGPCTDDQGLFWPSRARVAMEGQFTKNVSAWIEIQNTWVAGGTANNPNGNSPPGYVRGSGNNMELYQANLTLDELWSDSFSLTFGRQELVLGNELLFGDNDFYAGFTHDGLVGAWDFDKWDINVWYFREAEGSVGTAGAVAPPPFSIPGPTGAGGRPAGQDLYGAYATWNIGDNGMLLDFYAMYQGFRLDTGNNANPGPGTLNNLMTYGVRFARDMVMGEKGFMWNLEYAMQSGDIQNVSATVWGDSAEGNFLDYMFGYNFSNGDNNHKVYLRGSQMSGNDNPGGATASDYEGWIGMPGDIHDRFGKGDWFMPDTLYSGTGNGLNSVNTGIQVARGLDAWSIGYNGFFNDRHEFGVAYWDYQYNNSDNIGAAVSDDLGNAYDVWYGFNYTRNVAFEVSYSSLDPGDGLVAPATNNPTDSATRMYGQVRFRF